MTALRLNRKFLSVLDTRASILPTRIARLIRFTSPCTAARGVVYYVPDSELLARAPQLRRPAPSGKQLVVVISRNTASPCSTNAASKALASVQFIARRGERNDDNVKPA